MAMDKAGSHSDSTSDSWGSISCGQLTRDGRNAADRRDRGEVGGSWAAPAGSAQPTATVATAMAMMKAKRCKALSHSSPTISASVNTPMVVACGLIWPMRSSRSSAWATRFEKLLW